MNERQDHQPAKVVLGYLLAALSAFGFASGGLIGKWLMTEPSAETGDWLLPPLGIYISPEILSADRVLIAAVAMLVVLLIKSPRELKASPKSLGFFAIYGVLGLAMLHFTYYAAISVTNTSTAVLIEYLAPILIMLFGVIVFKDRITWRLPVGIALALFGAMLITGALLPGGLIVSVQGIAFGLGSAVFLAIYSMMGGFLGARYRTVVIMAFGMGFAALFWLIILGPSAVITPLTNLPILLTISVTALTSTVFATMVFLQALKFIKPANASMTCMIEPFIVAVGDLVLFNEVLAPIQLLGGALIVIAVCIVLTADIAKQRAMK